MLIGGIAIIAIGVLLLVGALLGVFHRDPKVTMQDKLSQYGPHSAPAISAEAPTQASMKDSAIEFTAKAIGSGGLEAKLSWKLDAAGLALKSPEWVLLHCGIGVGAGFGCFLLTSGNLLVTLVVVVLGMVAPWMYLGIKASRRIKGFNAQLPEALQLMSGGLSAGLSLPQSLDTIVREGTEPMAGEFRRALIEARLGVGIEDALDSVAVRMGSADFEWVVMAVRIQREVGGNLAELLLSVAGTLREREYLRRQVRSLSAEGRLSAWILGGMPPLFIGYLALTNPKSLSPLFETGPGIVLIVIAVVLMSVGSFWMSRVVKVEA